MGLKGVIDGWIAAGARSAAASMVNYRNKQVMAKSETRGIVKSINQTTGEVVVELLNKQIVTVQQGPRWLSEGGPTVVYGGRAN